MNKLNFHEFYDYIWEDEVLELVVSTKYIDENEDFIRQTTLDLFRFYELADAPPSHYRKFIEIMFTNLFAFHPKTQNIKEIKDNFPGLVGDNY